MPRPSPRRSLWIALAAAAGACAAAHSPPAASEAVPDEAAEADMDAIAMHDASAMHPASASDAADAARDATTSADAASRDGGPTEAVFEVLTKPIGGSDYEPLNVGAIWVEDEQGTPIKLLEQWGIVSSRFLVTYRMTGLAPVMPLRIGVDGISSATLRRHGSHRAVWDLTDRQGQPVADGVYTIRVEVTDNHDMPALTAVTFYKGSDPVEVRLEETERFGPITLSYR